MNKLYFYILFSFLGFLLLINVITFATNFNAKQLLNFDYIKDRSIASYYLAKNIIFYSGINIKYISSDEIEKLVDKVSYEYNIDRDLLKSFVNINNQFTITSTGGMGITSINVDFFNNTNLKDPFKAEENITATAQTIKNMLNDGLSIYQIINEFYGINSNVLKI